MPNPRRQAGRYSSAVLQSGTADRSTTQENVGLGAPSALARSGLPEIGHDRPLQFVGSNFVPPETSGRRRRRLRCAGNRQARIGPPAATACEYGLARNVDIYRGREFRREARRTVGWRGGDRTRSRTPTEHRGFRLRATQAPTGAPRPATSIGRANVGCGSAAPHAGDRTRHPGLVVETSARIVRGNRRLRHANPLNAAGGANRTPERRTRSLGACFTD